MSGYELFKIVWPVTVFVIVAGLGYIALSPPKPHHYLRFRRIFGYWPTGNEHLRPLLRRQVYRRLMELAADLNLANRKRDKFLGDMKKVGFSYKDALAKLPRLQRNSNRAWRKFKKARDVAVMFSLAEYYDQYTDYLKPRDWSEFVREPGGGGTADEGD
jgi:hypothetical protein